MQFPSPFVECPRGPSRFVNEVSLALKRCLCYRLDEKLAAFTLFSKGVAANARPVFAAKRNIWKNSLASKANVCVVAFPGLSLVFLRDWCVSAKLIADGNASRLSDSEAFLIRILVLPYPVKVKALRRMA